MLGMIHKIAGSLWKIAPRWTRRLITRTSQAKFTVSAGVIMMNSRKEILLLDHHIRPGSGWGIPGGFIDHGEQPEAGAAREVLEETGIGVAALELVSCTTRRGHLEFLFRTRSDETPSIDGREIKRAGWFRPEAFPEGMNQIHRERIVSAIQDWFDN